LSKFAELSKLPKLSKRNTLEKHFGPFELPAKPGKFRRNNGDGQAAQAGAQLEEKKVDVATSVGDDQTDRTALRAQFVPKGFRAAGRTKQCISIAPIRAHAHVVYFKDVCL